MPVSDRVEREIVLPVPPEEAWSLVADPTELERWLAPDVDLVPEPGAPLRVREADGTERLGIVEHVEEPSRLRFRWWPLGGEDESTVDLVLDAVAEGSTRLVVVEERTLPATGAPTAWGPRLAACAALCRA